MTRQWVTSETRGALAVLAAPTTALVVLFVVPFAVLVQMSMLKFPPNETSGLTLGHYRDVITDPLNVKIVLTTFAMVTAAMAVMLLIALPLAYYMVFKAGRRELFLLLAIVVADELAPVVRVYAWQVILGRNGLINSILPGPPVDWLLYSPFAVVIALVTSYITYTTIPIYAAMKAIEPVTLEAATDLGAGLFHQFWRILLPLAAPGILVAAILVYIPMYADFVAADILGGPSSYMLGQRVRDVILEEGDWGTGSAMNIVFALIAYRLSRLNRMAT
ncbi:ABC transporter permease [Mycolicibacterium austroafricanum]|uniref:ABC transporter permease n=1 Tax=Mycolicibacterium austroafricanum TaxID=39687 RepID=A0ABT8H721_MYCAO|nr:ABC transporter permease [Mycolicibacterium austroafricanum]MDN4516559.1 ABC transporter permease [Mycolicibacterium austroafricanum]QRZ07203.1 ABC transporter permease [Mycolicibacterium austroafricanum]QZT68688.1 ABC transporter permease [Mycolicibacterium austroafricanum]